MINCPVIHIKDFSYGLPDERIAQHPLEQRDSSKLLIWNDGVISEEIFSGIARHLPDESLLVFNDTKVIKARLLFTKATGATIEIFCLEPTEACEDPEVSLTTAGSATWNCLIGNLKRWKSGTLVKEVVIGEKIIILEAQVKDSIGDSCFSVSFRWEPATASFHEILDRAGEVPLPPYIHRPSGEEDESHYQTIYASHEGSVAAPTAGLHFTREVFESLDRKKISRQYVTLHVGLGTFRPVSAEQISGHIMHEEKISISRNSIRNIISSSSKPAIAVGTTSVRTLESLYWAGVKLLIDNPDEIPVVNQWDPYDERYDIGVPAGEALEKLDKKLEDLGHSHFVDSTCLMIVPGYRFRITGGMITNFHLPQSTLLLLIAAYAGDDWKRAYNYAMDNNFRFLSYGDACLFLKTNI
jgi:S-adenosylmethionine:tRNA ribosyltransferase-isomerase